MLPLITALGVAQIISWGSLFYAIGVLGAPMRAELGISELFLFSTFSAALVSGTLAPSAMSATLYDPAFATLSQHTGPRYRKAVTALTLFGGFASTVFWPLSHLLLEAWGWRITLAIYAGFHLFICLPIHQLLVPRHSHLTRPGVEAVPEAPSPGLSDPRLPWLTVSFAIATFIFGVIAVHLISLLTTAGLSAAQAVTISMLVGPMQVAGRIIELGFAGRVKAVTVGVVAFALMMLALVALITVEGFGIAALVFVIAYGCGNGVLTIVKGTAPVELFGRAGLGSLLGHLSRYGLYAKSIAPAAFSALLTFGFTRNAALSALALLAVGGMASYTLATRKRHDQTA